MAEKTRKRKIFWTSSENEIVAAHLWNWDGARTGTPGLIGKVRAAQELLLPPDRWRVIAGSDSIRGVTALLEKWAREKRGRIAPPALPHAEPPKPSSPEPLAPPAPALAPEPAPVQAARGSELLHEIDAALKTLAGVLAGRFLDHLQSELSQLASVRLPEIVSSVVPESSHRKLPRVLVMGLKPQQAGLIMQEFGACLDLRFWKEEGVTKLDSMAKNADVVVSMTDFITHSQEDHVKDLPYYRRQGGGLGGLRDTLTRLYVEHGGDTAGAGGRARP